jgi:hypothetical protein
MAKFNEILAGRFNRFLQKYLSMKGGPPAAQLASEIMGQFDVEDLPVELRALMGYDRFSVSIVGAAVAAQTSGLQLRNPLNSGVICILEKWTFAAAVASQQNLSVSYNGITAVDETNVLAGARLDGRQGGAVQSPLIVSFGNAFADLATQFAVFSNNTVGTFDLIIDKYHQLTIAPGQTIRLNVTTVNVAFNSWIIWRNRPLEDSELKV